MTYYNPHKGVVAEIKAGTFSRSAESANTVKVQFKGYFGKDNGKDSWILSSFTNDFATWEEALKFAGDLQDNTDKVVLEVKNLSTNEVQSF